MMALSDIASSDWDILKAKALYSRFDSFTARLACYWGGFKHPALFPPCCLSLVFVSICLLVFSRARYEDHVRTARAALQALVTIVVPTCSLWPDRYIELARVLRSRCKIPFEVIINDITNGVIEFRNPSNDLVDLIGSGAVVGGHTICISIGWRWWIKYFEWWILTESKLGCFFGLFDWLHHSMPIVSFGPLDLFPSSFTSSTAYPPHCLDRLPRGEIPILNAGCKATLEFTAFSPSLRTLSTAQIASAIPFMISERPSRRPRTLVSVIRQLSVSYGPTTVIESLLNVSADYEHALHRAHKSLSGEQRIREGWAKTMGIQAWRREVFLVALEAALMRRGWIERWAIQVTVK